MYGVLLHVVFDSHGLRQLHAACSVRIFFVCGKTKSGIAFVVVIVGTAGDVICVYIVVKEDISFASIQEQ